MMVVENHSKIDVSFSRNKPRQISETKEVHGAAIVDMLTMKAIIHSKMGVPSSINGAG